MHPHTECIYEKDGVMMSEDEEDCIEEYKLKGLIKKSAKFECLSLEHNKMSPAILSTVYNFSLGDWGDYEFNVTVIPEGVVVIIGGTRCDGKIDCWNGEDEEMCGFNTFVTFGAGTCLTFAEMLYVIVIPLCLGAIFILCKDIGVGWWSRKWQFSLTLCSENVFR